MCIDYIRTKGVKVTGYVHTKLGFPKIYAYRQYSEVTDDIDYWKSNYNLDGIFLDETSGYYIESYDSSTLQLAYYGNLTTYIQSLSS